MKGSRHRIPTAVVAAVLATFVACDGVRTVGDAMVDAGELLRDAAPDARAQEPRVFTAPCDRRDGTFYYAEIAASLDPATADVSAYVCDPDPPVGIGLGCSSAETTFDATRVRVACGNDAALANATARVVIRP
jgi:hypothetical protein